MKEVRWTTPDELYKKFLTAAKGLVITDPRVPGTVNVATMLAAVEGWLPVTPALYPEFASLAWPWTSAGDGRRTSKATGGSMRTMGRECHAGPAPITTRASSSSATTSWNSRYRWSGFRIPTTLSTVPPPPGRTKSRLPAAVSAASGQYSVFRLVGRRTGRRGRLRRERSLFGRRACQQVR